MGRHAGWITAAVGMADDADTPIPLVLLFPEIPFDEATFLAAVDAKIEGAIGYCCVGVSEGLQDAQGKLMAEAGTRDAFGHAQLGGVGPLIATLVKDKLGYKYHWAVADYLQRAARHLASKTDVAAVVRGRQGGGRDGARRAQRGDAGDHARRPTSRTAGRSPRRRCRRSPTSRRCCRATSSRRTATASPPRRALSRPADEGRGSAAVQGRTAAVRAAQERRGAPQARRPIQGVKQTMAKHIDYYFARSRRGRTSATTASSRSRGSTARRSP